jgi:mono/diheme cytochrome c family protein
MLSTAIVGIAFLAIGLAAMFLMFHLWGYPYDKSRRTSDAPRWAMILHRVLGYLFVVLYVLLMWKMVPRLYEYQVEFPARTTAHIILGFTVGFLLLVKIAILRFFRHFEEWMPVLGTAIMLGTVLLLGLSLPYVLQERALAQAAPGGDAMSVPSRARVAQLLPSAGLPADAPMADLATESALTKGREVLLGNCVKCHDLKTILAKPRTPAGWWSTVERMAEKPALFAPLSDQEMFEVTAYLIAITPDLQRSRKRRHQQEAARDAAVEQAIPKDAGAVSVATATPPAPEAAPPPAAAIDLAKAKATYEAICMQCHELSDVDAAPPKTAEDTREMIERMIKENEAELTAEEITLVAAWLDSKYVIKK